MKIQIVVAFGLIGLCSATTRPIIGILSQPVGSDLAQYGSSYIAASYVKYLESGGARVVPIMYNASTDELDSLFASINGVLFPGGGAAFGDSPFFETAQYLYNKALQAFDNQDYFPIVGHCLGFELLSVLTSKNQSILTPVNAENITLPLSLTPAAKTSRWLSPAPADVVQIVASEPVTMNNHMYAVAPADFEASQNLKQFYNVLATNQDRDGKTFISLMEGFRYPIYAAQWHPEKPQFEWNPQEVINHSPDAIYAMQYFGRFFVNEARKSTHAFPSQEAEQAALIYNYQPVYTEPFDADFEQCYVFP
eukprot:TRINITY_DN3492_c0_g1_i1.p2 TRINITY_DN3492_c0_g1~~TRINITY_DN3492_c0_g1_i1.p2  ORF type:complete len:308 (+),score=88.69 TRINITY_DN3492_c0_g1_i1:55-978(+)